MAELRPDPSLTTASVPPASAAPDKETDGQVVLAVLSREDSDAAGRKWENPTSGARGLISAVNRQEVEGQSCLAFTTTRESFDGINLYRGLACEDAPGFLRDRKSVV